jgi:hypothetical protein
VLDEALHVIQDTVHINSTPLALKPYYVPKEGIPTLACLQILEELALASLGDEACIKQYDLPAWGHSSFFQS